MVLPKAIRSLLWRLGQKYRYWLYRKYEVARVEGIALIDLRPRAPRFRETITQAIQLLKRDRRRFERVRRFIERIINDTRPRGGAAYLRAYEACEMEFVSPRSDYEVKFYAARCACTLVHEATHGYLYSHRIPYTKQYRRRVERLCVQEELRFAQRIGLEPEVVAWLKPKLVFNSDRWDASWNTTPREDALLAIKKIWRESRKN